MELEGIIAIALFVLVVQMVFSFFQLRYYDRFVKNIAKKYKDTTGYSLDTDTAKKRFKTAIAVLVSDKDNKIVEAYRYEGITVLAKFKPYEEVIGKQINEELSNNLKKDDQDIVNLAALKIVERKL